MSQQSRSLILTRSISRFAHSTSCLPLFSLIDDGKNPDGYTKDVINSCIAKNQITKGKTDAFKVPFLCKTYTILVS